MYALPLVTMDLTREQFFASPLAAGATPNRFLHIPILGNPTFRSVVRPNVDTLYSTAWLDLTTEPVLLTVPPSGGRYYMVQCMDAWTNVFSGPGIRTLGDRGATFAIVGPDWHGQPPPGVELVRSPTQMVWVLARVYVRDQADLADARVFQHKLDVRPLSRVDDATYQGVYPSAAARNIKRPIMAEQLRQLGAEAYFERFTRLTVANPPAPADAPFVKDVLERFGIAPGKSIVWAQLTADQRTTLAAALDRVLNVLDNRAQLQRQRALTPTGWAGMAGKTMQGVYGTDYPTRAAVTAIGLGANLRADAIYLNASVDGNRQLLDGSKRYRLVFPAGATPPARGFWSITIYDDQGYLVANPVERYAIKSADPLVREPDGSLVIYLGPEDPGPAHRANWLPSPANQRFELSLRAYWPDDAMLQGQWTPPAVMPDQG
jgi:hypothetical protein